MEIENFLGAGCYAYQIFLLGIPVVPCASGEFPGIIRAYKSRITEEKSTGPRHVDHKRRNGKI